MLNWPLATLALVVQVTGRLEPWAWLVVPVGAVTVMLPGPAAFTYALRQTFVLVNRPAMSVQFEPFKLT